MILYVNGNEHCGAAGARVHAAQAEDDVNLWWMGLMPHPANLEVSFGKYISSVLKARYINESCYGQTNQKIWDVTKHFLDHNPVHEQIVAIFGMPQNDLEFFKEFGQYLKDQNVKHIIYPHEDYVDWLTKNKFEPDTLGYFGEEAHRAWAGNLVKPLTRIL